MDAEDADDEVQLLTAADWAAARTGVDVDADPLRAGELDTRYIRNGATGVLRYFGTHKEQVRRNIIQVSRLGNKIAAYRRDDRAKGYTTDITPESCLDLLVQQNGRCTHCTHDVGIEEMSVNRVCNGAGHLIGRVEIVHPTCNSAMR